MHMVSVCVRESVHVCERGGSVRKAASNSLAYVVCVCERESVCVCVRVWERGEWAEELPSNTVCACVWERVCARVCVRERVCACVRVCERGLPPHTPRTYTPTHTLSHTHTLSNTHTHTHTHSITVWNDFKADFWELTHDLRHESTGKCRDIFPNKLASEKFSEQSSELAF